ncbi:MAG: L-lactate permease, partial [Oscillospiraceae bacterium]|nr:L-lactate permease [Oscillospiraceae bacterium]
GNFYPLFAPYIGLLGTFLTGNNTNSSVMFGGFQYAVAAELELNGAVMSAVQVIAGGVGCSSAPTLIFMAALATKQTEKVSVILKKLIPSALIIAGTMGIINFIMIRLI